MKTKTLSFMRSIAAIGVASLVLSACIPTYQPATETKTTPTTGAPAAEQKSGTTTKTGTLSQIGEKFFLAEDGQEPKEVNSYSVDLAEYVGQRVTVSGQYSGDTLYIGSIQIGEQ